ncbi:MAG TPA: hypothetical protein VNJ28_05765 [Candidatus Limnocylindrales bacterium]|nr:hypothetical protein [Candidatus Limnocylindrales bacterium]
MRPKRLVAVAAFAAAVALVALPGLAGSRSPRPEPTLEAAAFQAVILDASLARSSAAIPPVDPALRSAGRMEPATALVEPGESSTPLRAAARPLVRQPVPKPTVTWKPGRRTITGIATFYDNGTTAMRLPRGTIVRICGAAGCIERVVNDYGPSPRYAERIVDLYRPDFFRICGCPRWAGTTRVTVHIY